MASPINVCRNLLVGHTNKPCDPSPRFFHKYMTCLLPDRVLQLLQDYFAQLCLSSSLLWASHLQIMDVPRFPIVRMTWPHPSLVYWKRYRHQGTQRLTSEMVLLNSDMKAKSTGTLVLTSDIQQCLGSLHFLEASNWPQSQIFLTAGLLDRLCIWSQTRQVLWSLTKNTSSPATRFSTLQALPGVLTESSLVVSNDCWCSILMNRHESVWLIFVGNGWNMMRYVETIDTKHVETCIHDPDCKPSSLMM